MDYPPACDLLDIRNGLSGRPLVIRSWGGERALREWGLRSAEGWGIPAVRRLPRAVLSGIFLEA